VASRYWYLFFIPLFTLLAVVEFYPLLDSFYRSISTTGGLSLSNYQTMFTDSAFWNAVNISILYSLTSTLEALAIGLVLTFIVIQNLRGRSVFEAFFIMPLAVAPIVVGTLWSPGGFWDDIQTFNSFILHLPVFSETTPAFYFTVMTYSDAWEWAPLIMLVALSIYNATPKEIYEAAELHGASAFQKFRSITLPMVLRSPVMQFVVVLRFIDAMRAFEIPLSWSFWIGFSTSVGSPVDSLSLYLYKLFFIPLFNFPIGLISAIGILLFCFTLLGAAIMLRFIRVIGGQ